MAGLIAPDRNPEEEAYTSLIDNTIERWPLRKRGSAGAAGDCRGVGCRGLVAPTARFPDAGATGLPTCARNPPPQKSELLRFRSVLQGT